VRIIITIKHPKLMQTSFCFHTGTMGLMNESKGSFTPEVGSLFSFSKDWKPTKHTSKITVSNGLAWSEDSKTMYYIDSTTKKVDAFDFDAENGKICEYSCCNSSYESVCFSIMFRTSV
jgi:sugar lactone lactonase YvrE